MRGQPNEVKVLINDIAVPTNSILDYQNVLITSPLFMIFIGTDIHN